MPNQINNRPYSKEKTGIDDLEKLKQVKNSLAPYPGIERLRDRARIRRQSDQQPISSPVINHDSNRPNPSNAPYRINHYNPDTDRWSVQSTANPSDSFSGIAIKSGGIAIGSLVRGYPPKAIEPQPQGRRFKPVETKPVTEVKNITIKIAIGYTGKR